MLKALKSLHENDKKNLMKNFLKNLNKKIFTKLTNNQSNIRKSLLMLFSIIINSKIQKKIFKNSKILLIQYLKKFWFYQKLCLNLKESYLDLNKNLRLINKKKLSHERDIALLKRFLKILNKSSVLSKSLNQIDDNLTKRIQTHLIMCYKMT